MLDKTDDADSCSQKKCSARDVDLSDRRQHKRHAGEGRGDGDQQDHESDLHNSEDDRIRMAKLHSIEEGVRQLKQAVKDADERYGAIMTTETEAHREKRVKEAEDRRRELRAARDAENHHAQERLEARAAARAAYDAEEQHQHQFAEEAKSRENRRAKETEDRRTKAARAEERRQEVRAAEEAEERRANAAMVERRRQKARADDEVDQANIARAEENRRQEARAVDEAEEHEAEERRANAARAEERRQEARAAKEAEQRRAKAARAEERLQEARATKEAEERRAKVEERRQEARAAKEAEQRRAKAQASREAEAKHQEMRALKEEEDRRTKAQSSKRARAAEDIDDSEDEEGSSTQQKNGTKSGARTQEKTGIDAPGRKNKSRKKGKKKSTAGPEEEIIYEDGKDLTLKTRTPLPHQIKFYHGSTLEILRLASLLYRIYLLTKNRFPSASEQLKAAKKFFKSACRTFFGQNYKGPFAALCMETLMEIWFR